MISAAFPPANRTPAAPVMIRRVGAVAIAAGTALVAACTTPASAPPPPPPPPPVAEVVPYRPLPPAGASYVMKIPPMGPDGKRITVNSNLSDDRLVWHLRSAWNVAALNCLGSEHEPILTGYRAFLTNNVRSLKALNDRIEKTYGDRYRVRRDAVVARDAESTQVYNFFANPAARSGFCQAALDVANRYLAEPKAQPLAFAQANFPVFMAPHEDFFNQYEAYQRASAEWDEKYGEKYGPSQPGWVAVQQARANGEEVPTYTNFAAAAVTQTVVDPETGVAVPVIPVQEGFVSQPVIEPLAAPKPAPSPATKRKR
ncbi:MAG: hypothetical protein ACK4IS_06265 [Erythrobacter sp.]